MFTMLSATYFLKLQYVKEEIKKKKKRKEIQSKYILFKKRILIYALIYRNH